MSDGVVRCPWCLGSDIYKAYHDTEWGRPLHDERRLFEMLILEGAQAGLSWSTILYKRDNYRLAFEGFDAEKIARYGDAERERLLGDAGIVRNKLKIDAAIGNARAYLRLRESGATLDRWLWNWVDGQPIVNRRSGGDVPAKTELSDRISKALLKQGYKFVGSTIIYAYMQSIGMVNDHLLSCDLHPENLASA